MKTFPMFLRMHDRRVVIIGGGEQAAQKTRLMLKTEAEIVLVADELEAELLALVEEGRISVRAPRDIEGLFDNTVLVFVATGCKGADAAWHGVARQSGAVVNVVDYPELCEAMTPSLVDRDPVVVAIGTEGTAPVLGRLIKSRIEEMLEPRLGVFAATAGRLRGAVAARVAPAERRQFWRWVFGDAPRKSFAAGHEREAIAHVKDAIATGGAPVERRDGRLSIVDASDLEPDCATLRLVNRLQEADALFFDAHVCAGILELARRDAERVEVNLPDVSTDKAVSFVRQRAAELGDCVWLVGTQYDAIKFLLADTPVERLPQVFATPAAPASQIQSR